MKTSISRLESGQEYTLKQLLNGENKIVIPDLQRDYCWGDKAYNKTQKIHTELVSSFLDSLLEAYREKREDKLMLGLIYGYENPHFTIQLCDGQQRLTTLFLLIGMLNRKAGQNQFKNILISENEFEDDREPNLLYAIRESTLYFLSDLVCEFFLNNETSIAEIKNKDWYFREYELDASIQSMINAIKTIENKINNIDCYDFAIFIINNLQMLYYDMGHRTRGEETFVIINTTGEPLTATENLKPILIGNITNEEERNEASKKWEDREEWFWLNKNKGEQTSDNALNEFFVWYWQIRLRQEKTWKEKKSYSLNPNQLFQKKPLILEGEEETPDVEKWEESKNIEVVQKYFEALKLLVEKSQGDEIPCILKTILNEEISLSWLRKSSLDVVLPLISYLVKFPQPIYFKDFVRRIRKNYFDKKRNSGNFVDWRYIIQIITNSYSENEVLKFETTTAIQFPTLKTISNVPLNEWYNYDEINKDLFKVNHKQKIEKWEDHDEFYGDLSFLWSINQDKNSDFNQIKNYFDTFNTLLNCFKKDVSNDNAILSNYIRLYKLLLGYPKIGHIDYCSWDIEGAWFSWRDTNSVDYLRYLKDDKIKSLLSVSQNEMIDVLKNRIKDIVLDQNILEINENNFSALKHLKYWLLIKVLNANSKNTLLSLNDHYGIGSYVDCKRNKLNPNLEFSIANSICGYAIKSPANRIDYGNKDEWNDDSSINTTVGESLKFEIFKNKDKEPVSNEVINQLQFYIDSLTNTFLN